MSRPSVTPQSGGAAQAGGAASWRIGRRRGTVSAAAGILAWVLVYLLLAPTSGIDTLPPECYAYPGYVVPCGSGLWLVVAFVAALLIGSLTYLLLRFARVPGRS